MLIDHIPLVVGAALVAFVHLVRTWVVAGNTGVWTRLLDAVLLVAELTLLVSLVASKALDLIGELGEGVGVAKHRIAKAWRSGERSPPPPRL